MALTPEQRLELSGRIIDFVKDLIDPTEPDEWKEAAQFIKDTVDDELGGYVEAVAYVAMHPEAKLKP